MTEDRSVLAMFVDVRGFTKWSEANEVFINLESFTVGFMDILRRHFPAQEYALKPLGDGAMLTRSVPDNLRGRELSVLLGRTLNAIKRVDVEFRQHCREFAHRVGHSANLGLGWGVVRGKVIRAGDDWTGHNLSKCSRLCDEARPFGVVLDRDDFPELPRNVPGFVAQVRRLRGIGEVSVWVTSEIASQFVPRERLRETPEVHVAGTCFRLERRGRLSILLARRALDRALFPGRFEGCGGQLRYSEGFTDGVRRHFEQELGIEVDAVPGLHRLYEIREPNEPVIPGIRFLCRQMDDREPHSANHSELLWVSEKQFRRMAAAEFVGDLRDEVVEMLDQYREGRA